MSKPVEHGVARDLLNSLGHPAALVGRSGVFEHTNDRWNALLSAMPLPAEQVSAGASFLDACVQAQMVGLEAARSIHEHFQGVIAGTEDRCEDIVHWELANKPRLLKITLAPVGAERDMVLLTIDDQTEARNRQMRLEYQATHDQLTDLANRGLFLELFGQAMTVSRRHDYQVAVLFCDLDGFKSANEIVGHQLGDELLISAASRLKSCVRPSDVVARFGGDEFLVMLPDVDDPSAAEAIAHRLIAEMGRPFRLHEHRVHVGLSIGIALAGDDEDPEDVINRANQAMFAAKVAGKGRYQVSGGEASPSIGFRSRLDVSQLSEEHMLTYFQPIIDNRDGSVVGAEALLRWAHPQYGVLTASEFLSLAVNSGQIATLAEQALICAAEAWVDVLDHLEGTSPVLFVNLSVDQLRNRTSVDRLRHILQATGLPPEGVVVEIAEGALSAAYRELAEVLVRLRSVGIRIALDDFGSAYSSLGRLRQVPVEVLKLDRSMVRGIERDQRACSIVRAVAQMAQDLGIDCIAEGCEQPREAEMLAELGIRYVQGYHYGYPVGAREFISNVLGRELLHL